MAAANERGIAVTNTPGVLTEDTADLTMALIMAVSRRIVEGANVVQAGGFTGWTPTWMMGRRVNGKRLGIIGMGRIGQAVARRAKAFGMQIHYHNRKPVSHVIAEELEATYWESLDQMLARMDIISVNCPHTPATYHLLSARRLKLLQPHAVVVNTARGGIIDEGALADLLAAGAIAGAGLDVFEREPSGGTGAFEDEVGRLPGVVGTHHVGASTEQAQNAIAAEVVRIVSSFKSTGEVPNAVNLCERSPARWLLTVRHRDRVGVLAHVFGALREAGINVQQTENVVFDGAEAASARIQLDNEPTRALLAKVAEGCRDILSISLNPL